MTQPSLFTASKAPRVSEQDVDRLLAFLDGLGWVTAAQLVGTHDWNDAQGRSWTDRDLRAIRAASQGRIISGQRGYCRIEEATEAEARHSIAWKRHQAAEMLANAREEEQVLNGRLVRSA